MREIRGATGPMAKSDRTIEECERCDCEQKNIINKDEKIRNRNNGFPNGKTII